MEDKMSTDVMSHTARLRWLLKDQESDLVLQQWWSNADAVKMGPTHMVKGEWRDVEVVDES
jgi:hypothetical protein